LLKIVKTDSFGSGPTINNTRLLKLTKLSSSVSPRSRVPKSFARCRPTALQVLYLVGSDGSLLDFGTTATSSPLEQWSLRAVLVS
jgi:hypothetical protein